MKAVNQALKPLLFLLLTTQITPFSYWFEITESTTDSIPMEAFTVAGSTDNYIVFAKGGDGRIRSFEVDFQAGALIERKKVSYGNGLTSPIKLSSDGTYNVVIVSSQGGVRRIYTEDMISPNLQYYPSIPTDVGYSHSQRILGTAYVFFATLDAGSGNSKVYRVLATTTSGVASFSLSHNSEAYGALYGSRWILVSLSGSDQRLMLDYTNGHDGGSVSSTQNHTKPSGVGTEASFMCPEDQRGYYVVGGKNNKKILAVKETDGSDHLERTLSDLISTTVRTLSWVKGSNFLVFAGATEKFGVVDFMDKTKFISPKYSTLRHSSSMILNIVAYKEHKVSAVIGAGTESHIEFHKLLDEAPCDPTCGKTCEDIFKTKCLVCPKTGQIVRSGTTCFCPVGTYEGASACLSCSSGCQQCSSSSSCSTCSKSYFSNYGNGQCGCPTGKYDSQTGCVNCKTNCAVCDSSGACSTCSRADFQINGDGTCGCPLGTFDSGTACVACSGGCQKCSGPLPSDCIGCSSSDMSMNSQGVCECKFGYKDQNGTCKPCPLPCFQCQSADSSTCTSCQTGYFLSTTDSKNPPKPCQDCSQEHSSNPSCPPPFTFDLNSTTLEEGSKTVSIEIKPDLSTKINNPGLSPLSLANTNFNLTIKRNFSTDLLPLLIRNCSIFHQGDKSVLVLAFMQEIAVQDTEYLSVTIKDPWIYVSNETFQLRTAEYFKQGERQARVVQSSKNDEKDENWEKREKAAETSGKVVGGVIWASTTVSVVFSLCTSSLAPFFVYAIKFFNILKILQNLTKINVKIGRNLSLIISFIKNLQPPELSFLTNPIFQKSENSTENNNFWPTESISIRGSRGKLTREPKNLFIAHESHLPVAVLIIVLFILVALLEQLLSRNSCFLFILSYCYELLVGSYFFNFQMITSTEIGFFNYETLRGGEMKYTLSLLASITISNILLGQLMKMKILAEKEELAKPKFITKRKVKEILRPREALIYQRFTLELSDQEIIRKSNFLVWEAARFMLLQVLIATLQLLSRTQSILILIANLVYFLKFIFDIWTRNVFCSKWVLAKYITQEICILVTVFSLTLFSLTEGKILEDSFVYKLVDGLTALSVLIAALSEIGALAYILIAPLFTRPPKRKTMKKFVIAKSPKKGAIKHRQPKPRPSLALLNGLKRRSSIGLNGINHRLPLGASLFTGQGKLYSSTKNLIGDRDKLNKLKPKETENHSQTVHPPKKVVGLKRESALQKHLRLNKMYKKKSSRNIGWNFMSKQRQIKSMRENLARGASSGMEDLFESRRMSSLKKLKSREEDMNSNRAVL